MRNIKRVSLLALMVVLFIAFNGCGDDGNDVKSHLNEHDFTKNPSLVATTYDVVIINLEHPDAADVHELDSYVIGIDRIPLNFPEDISHEFVVEYKEERDAYFVVLLNEEGLEILRVDRGNTTVTENITAGTYTLEIHHGSGIGGSYTLFVRPGSTYTGGDCPRCDLRYADLSGANLSGADLSGSELTEANLINADLSSANLSITKFWYANLTNADLSSANLTGANFYYASLNLANLSGADLTGAKFYYANLTNADLSDADLIGANLTNADLSGTELTNADLSDAILTYANLLGADLLGANLTNTDLTYATWTDGSRCEQGSIGMCRH